MFDIRTLAPRVEIEYSGKRLDAFYQGNCSIYTINPKTRKEQSEHEMFYAPEIDTMILISQKC